MLTDWIAHDISEDEMKRLVRNLPLKRGIFPRPFTVTTSAYRDITMQNIPNTGDFEHYQGIWRMHQLDGCTDSDGDSGNLTCRLTYAVEIRPKGFLPVGLIESRISTDLKANLKAIKAYVEAKEVINNIKIKEELAKEQMQAANRQDQIGSLTYKDNQNKMFPFGALKVPSTRRDTLSPLERKRLFQIIEEHRETIDRLTEMNKNLTAALEDITMQMEQ
jgi:hypothetical protein